MKNLFKTTTPVTIFLIAVFCASCEKDNYDQEVKYYVKGLTENYEVSYINENGETITEQVAPISVNDSWSYTFMGEPGDIVYLYTQYYDVAVNEKNFTVRILIEDKIFKDAYGYDKEEGDTVFYILRSGTIPY
ncbi:MAG: hypothetical protein ABII90_01965 [Bacteroidota bacterium]